MSLDTALIVAQVLIGFVGTGCLIVLILIGHYIFTYDPTLDPFRGPEERHKRSSVPDVVDVVVLKRLRGAMSLLGTNFEWLNNHNGGTKMEKALNKVHYPTYSTFSILTKVSLFST